MKSKIINTKKEARHFAQEWQSWQSRRNMSYAEIIKWSTYFAILAKKFDLTNEFIENGII